MILMPTDFFLADLGPEKSYEETALPEGVTPLN